MKEKKSNQQSKLYTEERNIRTQKGLGFGMFFFLVSIWFFPFFFQALLQVYIVVGVWLPKAITSLDSNTILLKMSWFDNFRSNCDFFQSWGSQLCLEH